MSLTARTDRVTLDLVRPFTIARGTKETSDVIFVELADDDGVTGVGAAAPSGYYGETPGTVEAVLPALLDVVESASEPLVPTTLESRLHAAAPRNPAAQAAVSIAIHDLLATRQELPVCRSLGLPTEVGISSSFTIGIDAPDAMAAQAQEAVDAGHEILKLKVGTDQDRAALAAVREAVPDARIRVDANEGWTPPQAIDMIEVCAGHDVELVEQPVPASDAAGLKRVYERSTLPILADESCVRASDVPRVADRCDAVNLKLMKSGGIREGIRLIHAARAHHLEVMLGCMIESGVSIAAAAHLSPLVDYADLDGALLVENDPITGSPVRPGAIELSAERPGLGVDRA